MFPLSKQKWRRSWRTSPTCSRWTETASSLRLRSFRQVVHQGASQTDNQLRQLIAAQSRQITLRMTLKQQTNPLLTLSPHLDPTVASGGNQAIISKDIFNTGIKFAEQEAQRVLSAVIPMPELKKLLDVPQDKRNQELANVRMLGFMARPLISQDAALRYRFHTSVLWYTKGGADAWVMGPRGAVHVPPAPAQPASGAATPSNATSQGPVQPISHPNANAKQQVKGKPAAKPNNTASASPAVTAGGTNATDSSSSTPAGTSVKTESDTNPLAGIPRQPPVAGDSQPQAGLPTTGLAVHPSLSVPPAQSAVPRPPPVPVEPESTRRKRKLKEFLQEESPGMEYETGVVEV